MSVDITAEGSEPLSNSAPRPRPCATAPPRPYRSTALTQSRRLRLLLPHLALVESANGGYGPETKPQQPEHHHGNGGLHRRES